MTIPAATDNIRGGTSNENPALNVQIDADQKNLNNIKIDEKVTQIPSRECKNQINADFRVILNSAKEDQKQLFRNGNDFA